MERGDGGLLYVHAGWVVGRSSCGTCRRGFHGRRHQTGTGLVPPGQYLVDDFPVLSAGPTPHTPLEEWDFTIVDENGTIAARWTWDELRALPAESPTVDIHCVTRWSKLATRWEGVSVDRLLAGHRHHGRVRHRLRRRRVHDEPPPRRCPRWQGLGGVRLRR